MRGERAPGCCTWVPRYLRRQLTLCRDAAARASTCEDRMDILAATLEWRHLSPTSPDTLPTFPFEDRDPFILTESPHCYFVGNQPEFATRLIQGRPRAPRPPPPVEVCCGFIHSHSHLLSTCDKGKWGLTRYGYVFQYAPRLSTRPQHGTLDTPSRRWQLIYTAAPGRV